MAADLEYTHVFLIPAIIEDLNRAFQSGLTRPLEYRKKQLRGLYNLIDENEDEFVEALRKDLRKPKMEVVGGELPPLKEDILYFLKNLDKLAKPKKVKPRMSVNAMDRIEVRRDPLGTVLIIGAWNYPVQLLLLPAVGAIAAGNTIVLKPSEVAIHTAALITKLIPRYIDSKCYQVVNGAVEETTELLKHRFDHIFYTGNGNVGKIVSTAAAKHLTPVTLELGGKSPAIVADDADLNIVANRIAFGKWYNAGQTCIAPDYVLIHPTRAPALIASLKKSVTAFFGDDPKRSPDYCRIGSARQFDRLARLLEDRPHGSHVRGGIALGGDHDRDELYIAPTILADVDGHSDSTMLDEIFGPILPILTVASIDEAIRFVNAGDTPLAIYLFTNKNRISEKVLTTTRSGAAVVNDCLVHAVELSLPFGGVGGSGTGNYHGIYSFNIFTHERATMVKKLGLEGVNSIIKYPPYSERKLAIIKFLTTSTPWFKKGWLKTKIAGSILVFLAVLILAGRRRRQ